MAILDLISRVHLPSLIKNGSKKFVTFTFFIVCFICIEDTWTYITCIKLFENKPRFKREKRINCLHNVISPYSSAVHSLHSQVLLTFTKLCFFKLFLINWHVSFKTVTCCRLRVVTSKLIIEGMLFIHVPYKDHSFNVICVNNPCFFARTVWYKYAV